MGYVRTDLAYFCPLDDSVTLEEIVEQIIMRLKIEQEINSTLELW